MDDNVGMVELKAILKQKKYSQLKVSMDLNISREALSHYENGKRSPDIQMLRQLSKYFNTSIDFLINREEFCKHLFLFSKISIILTVIFDRFFNYLLLTFHFFWDIIILPKILWGRKGFDGDFEV
ncbi:MAG: helix-turn-helix transcriptional regulator [Clostridia bacterium]|nr:helix-turn-helix transcriptional regulator [Clostridia bacterium]